MQTTTLWKSGQAFESHFNSHSIMMDSSTASGGNDSGISPKALLLSALAGCTGIDVVSILEKMKVKFEGIRIDVQAEQTEEHPRVFKDISMIYSVKTAKENEEKVRKAIDLSNEKYCGVAAMLRKNSPIHVKLIIEEPA